METSCPACLDPVSIHVRQRPRNGTALPALGTDPMSALHYFVGPREIRRLRAQVERAEGASFDSRKFHRRLLEEGPVPARWIAAAWGLPDAEPGDAP